MLTKIALALLLIGAAPRSEVLWYRQSEAEPLIQHWIRLEVTGSRVNATFIELGLGNRPHGSPSVARGEFRGTSDGKTFRVSRQKATLKGSFFRSLGIGRTEPASLGGPYMRVAFILNGRLQRTPKFDRKEPTKEELALLSRK